MSGDVATYIPELATVEPDGFGAVLVSVHGSVQGAGDADRPFTNPVGVQVVLEGDLR